MEVPAPEESEAPALVVVGEWSSFIKADEHALVGLATNHECWIFPAGDGFAVWATPEAAPALRREFSLYAAEQVERRERVEPPLFPAGIELMLLWIIALTSVFMLQGRDAAFTERFCNSSRALVEGGEWWRPFTALFLHADAGHLLSNVGIGGIFCVMAAQTLGLWRAWLLILASGTLGNAINAWARFPDDFNSIGASTATFGALGLLIGSALVSAWRAHSLRELRPLLAPLIVGVTMLGMYGAGGEQTDVAGHFAGWSFGVLLGSLARRKDLPLPGSENTLAGLARSSRQMDS